MGFEEVRDKLARIAAVHIGVDIGQKVDHTAIVVTEVAERPLVIDGVDQHYIDWHGKTRHVLESTYRVHEVRRLPLGTPFVVAAHEIVQMVASVHEMERVWRREGLLTQYEHTLTVDLWMDATGLGAPIVELVEEALRSARTTDRTLVHPVVFNYGDRYKRGEYEGRGDVLGKAYLVNRLQILLEQNRIDLPKSDPQIADMVEELKAYEIRIDTDANEKYGAFEVGTHDDMVTALGLACLEDPGMYTIERGPNLFP